MPNIRLEQMTPTQKVAALLITLGPSAASEVMKHIEDESTLEQITIEIAGLSKLPQDVIEAIVEEFHAVFQASSLLAAGGMNYARELLEKAYGSSEANEILNKLVTILNSNPFQFFNEADPVQLATSFQNENPQLIALILAYSTAMHYYRYRMKRDVLSAIIIAGGILGTVTSLIGFIVRTW